MHLFLWTFVVLQSLSGIGALCMLAQRDYQQRTPTQLAVQVVFTGAFVCWAAVLLAL